MERNSALYRYTPMTLVLFIWGFMNVPTTFALRELSPLQLLMARTVLATALLAPLAWFRERKILPERGDLLTAAAMGISGVIGNNLCFFYSLKLTSLTNVAIIFATSPLITTVLATIFLGEKLSVRRVCGIALALGGVILLLCNGDLTLLRHLTMNKGDLLEFGAATCCSVMTIFGRKIKRSSPFTVTFFNMLVSAIITAIICAALGETLNIQVTSVGLLAVGYVGLLGSGCGYVFQQMSIGRIGASATSAFLNGTPAISLFGATVIMGESISLVQMISAVVIFIGIFLNAGAKSDP